MLHMIESFMKFVSLKFRYCFRSYLVNHLFQQKGLNQPPLLQQMIQGKGNLLNEHCFLESATPFIDSNRVLKLLMFYNTVFPTELKKPTLLYFIHFLHGG